ncbi:MAG: hypothetical protein HYY37_00450 [Candidatus Aenigmarchaeota archaeon]|nr:hypothetical protein [Candidatus Aenigmarchaeota archaeon]
MDTKLYYVMILVICGAMAVATAASFQQAAASEVPVTHVASSQLAAAPYNETTPAGPVMRNDEARITQNGLALRMYTIASDDEKNLTLVLHSEDKAVYFNMTIQPGTYTYAQLNGMLIVPRTNIGIIPEKTSFYLEGNELIVTFGRPGLRELSIYTGRKSGPVLVTGNATLAWTYDDTQRLLLISSDQMPEKVYIFWESLDTHFIEDTEHIETLKNSLSSSRSATLGKHREAARIEAPLAILQADVRNLSDRIDALRFDRSSLEARISDAREANILLDANVTAYRNSVTANVLLAPSNVSIALMTGFIAAVLLADALLFVRKVKKT